MRTILKRILALAITFVVLMSILPLNYAHAEAPYSDLTVDIVKSVAYLKDNASQDVTIPLYRLESGEVAYCLSDDEVFNPSGDYYGRIYPFDTYSWDDTRMDIGTYSGVHRVLNMGYPKEQPDSWLASNGLSLAYFQSALTEEQREYGTSIAIICMLNGGIGYFDTRFMGSADDMYLYVKCLLENSPSSLDVRIYSHQGVSYDFAVPQTLSPEYGLRVAGSVVVNLTGYDWFRIDASKLPDGTIITKHNKQSVPINPSSYTGNDGDVLCIMLPASQFGKAFDYQGVFYSNSGETSFFWYESYEYEFDPSRHPIVAVCEDEFSGDYIGDPVYAGISVSDGVPDVSYVLRMKDAWHDSPITNAIGRYSITQNGSPIGFTKTGDGKYTYPGSEMVLETHNGEIYLYGLPNSVHAYPGSTDVIAPYIVTETTPLTDYTQTGGTFSFDVRYYNNTFSPIPYNPHFGQVRLIKQDNTNATPLEGAVFGIFNASSNAKVGELRTGVDGTAMSVDEARGGYYPLVPSDYYLKELKPPTGYAIVSTHHPFSITSNGQIVDVTVTNEPTPPSTGVIVLTKLSHVTREPLDNAVYGVYRESDDELMCEITTSSDGTGVSVPLARGTFYYLKEITPPDGFELDDTTIHRIFMYTTITRSNVTAYNKHTVSNPPSDNPTVGIEKYAAYLKNLSYQDVSIPLYRLDSGDVAYCLEKDDFNPGGDDYNAFDPLEPTRFDNENTKYATYNDLVRILMLGYPKEIHPDPDSSTPAYFQSYLTDEQREYGTALAIWSSLQGGVNYFKGRFSKSSNAILYDYVVYLLETAIASEFNYNRRNESFINIMYAADHPTFHNRPFRPVSHSGNWASPGDTSPKTDYISASFTIYLSGVDRVYFDEDKLPPGTLIHSSELNYIMGDPYMISPSEFIGYDGTSVTLYLPYSIYGQHIDLNNVIYGETFEQTFFWYEPDNSSLQTVVAIREGSRIADGDKVYASLNGDTRGTVDGFAIQKRDLWQSGISWSSSYDVAKFSISQDGTVLGFTEISSGKYSYPGDETILATSSNGDLTVSGLAATLEYNTPIASPYILTEVVVPYGFDPIDPIEFNFNVYLSLGTRTIYNTPQFGQVKLVKQGEMSSVLLEGAVFGIYNASNNAKEGELRTGADGTALSITEKTGSYYPLRLGSYYLKELTPPADYALNTTQYPFTISAKGEIIEVICTNTRIPPLTGVIELLKRDADTHEPLENAVFGVYKTADDEKVGEITTALDGTGVSAPLVYGDYYVKEITAPENYVLDDTTTYPATINAGNTRVSVTADNEKIPTATVTLIKVDADNANTKLSCARFGIYREADDGLEQEITTGSDGTATSDPLLLGDYYLKEITAPIGYIQDGTKRSFTLSDADENIVITVANTRISTPTTPPAPPTIITPYTPSGGHLRIFKRDAVTGAPLSGAMFTIYTIKGEFIADMISGIDGYATSPFLDSGEYYLTERVAPTGYNPIMGNLMFVIDNSGITRELTVKNTPNGMGTVIFEYRHVDDGRELDKSVSYTDVIGTEYIPWAVDKGHDKKPIPPYTYVKVDYPAQTRIIDGVLIVTYWYDDDVNGGNGNGTTGSDGTGGGTSSSMRANEVPGGSVHAIPKTGEAVPYARYSAGLILGGIAFVCWSMFLLIRNKRIQGTGFQGKAQASMWLILGKPMP